MVIIMQFNRGATRACIHQQGTTDSQGNTVDVAFYNTFWGLQPLFANPVTVLEKGMWGHMVRDVKTVLQRFQQQPVSTTAATLDEGMCWCCCVYVGGLYAYQAHHIIIIIVNVIMPTHPPTHPQYR